MSYLRKKITKKAFTNTIFLTEEASLALDPGFGANTLLKNTLIGFLIFSERESSQKDRLFGHVHISLFLKKSVFSEIR